MAHKLNIIREIIPEKSPIQRWRESPVGWWEVTTEGDCEGRTTSHLGTYYGHVAEIAFSLKCGGYSLQFRKIDTQEPPPENHTPYQIVTKKTNISFFGLNTGNSVNSVREWLDCPEIEVSHCNFYGAYTITLLDIKK